MNNRFCRRGPQQSVLERFGSTGEEISRQAPCSPPGDNNTVSLAEGGTSGTSAGYQFSRSNQRIFVDMLSTTQIPASLFEDLYRINDRSAGLK